MQIRTSQFERRVKELDLQAEQVLSLAYAMATGQKVQPHLSVTGQSWYRSARELLLQNDFSGLPEFERCYEDWVMSPNGKVTLRAVCDMEQFFNHNTSDSRQNAYIPARHKQHYDLFMERFRKARSLLLAAVGEIKSRETCLRSELSLALAEDEFQTAQVILSQADHNEALVRASGVVGRVALERHLFTIADIHKIPIAVHPPSKSKPDASDAINTLAKHGLVTAIQRSELEMLFKIGNHCAHPKDTVIVPDVQRLLNRGQELLAEIQ